MSPEWLGASARYNRWMNDKLYGLAATLSDEARKRDRGAFFKSIHGTLNHLLLADRVWLARFKGIAAPDGFMAPGGIRSLDQELYADFEALRRERVELVVHPAVVASDSAQPFGARHLDNGRTGPHGCQRDPAGSR